MPSIPKYLVNLVHGKIVITKSNGEDADEELLSWIKRLITRELKIQNFRDTHTGKTRKEVMSGADVVDGTRHHYRVDPLLQAINEERLRQDITHADWARACFITHSQLTDYLSGRSRPTVETLRLLAYTVGWKLQVVPIKPDPKQERSPDGINLEHPTGHEDSAPEARLVA